MNAQRQIRSPKLGELVFVRELGKGAYGSVFEVKSRTDKFALKEQWKLPDRERELMELFRTKVFVNLVNTLDVFSDKQKWYICMEYCEMNLYQRIKKSSTIKPEEFRYAARQIANGVKELHDLNIIHRDLKPENICEFMIIDNRRTTQLTYKICDFGMSKEQDPRMTQNQGTPYYQAPEQIYSQNYDKSIDIWALGCIYYELMTGQPLFNGKAINQIHEQIYQMTQKDIHDKIDSIKLLYEKYRDLLKLMIVRDPKGRINIDQVIKRLEPSISKSVEKQTLQPKIPLKVIHNYANPKTAIEVQQNLPQPEGFSGTFNNNKNSQQNDLTPKPQSVYTLQPTAQQKPVIHLPISAQKYVGQPIVVQNKIGQINSQSIPKKIPSPDQPSQTTSLNQKQPENNPKSSSVAPMFGQSNQPIKITQICNQQQNIEQNNVTIANQFTYFQNSNIKGIQEQSKIDEGQRQMQEDERNLKYLENQKTLIQLKLQQQAQTKQSPLAFNQGTAIKPNIPLSAFPHPNNYITNQQSNSQQYEDQHHQQQQSDNQQAQVNLQYLQGRYEQPETSKKTAIGLKNISFVNSSGKPEGNISSQIRENKFINTQHNDTQGQANRISTQNQPKVIKIKSRGTVIVG